MTAYVTIHYYQPLTFPTFLLQTSNLYFNDKIKKYHKCNTIVFGDVHGSRKMFLIQNVIPAIAKIQK